MFNQDAFAGQSQVVGFLFLVQRMEFVFLGRCLAVAMDFGRALVPGISQQQDMRRQTQATFLEQLKSCFFPAQKAADRIIPAVFSTST